MGQSKRRLQFLSHPLLSPSQILLFLSHLILKLIHVVQKSKEFSPSFEVQCSSCKKRDRVDTSDLWSIPNTDHKTSLSHALTMASVFLCGSTLSKVWSTIYNFLDNFTFAMLGLKPISEHFFTRNFILFAEDCIKQPTDNFIIDCRYYILQ